MDYTEYSIEKAKVRETNKVLKYNNDINYIEHFKMIFEKEKVRESNIKSAFLKGNTNEHLLLFYANQPIALIFKC